MKRHLVDTNIFLRAILDDHRTQSPKAQAFLEQVAASKHHYYTTPWVIAETVWTLSSFYKYRRSDVARIVKGIINTPNLEVLEEELVLGAVTLFEEKGIDFIDGLNYLVSKRRGFDGIISFDRDFDKLKSLKRYEP